MGYLISRTLYILGKQKKVSTLDNNKGFINLHFMQKINCQNCINCGTRLDSSAWYNNLSIVYLHSVLYTVYCSVHSMLYTVNCSLFSSLYYVQCTVYSVQCTVCSVQ